MHIQLDHGIAKLVFLFFIEQLIGGEEKERTDSRLDKWEQSQLPRIFVYAVLGDTENNNENKRPSCRG
jgi:hypothetical protein